MAVKEGSGEETEKGTVAMEAEKEDQAKAMEDLSIEEKRGEKDTSTEKEEEMETVDSTAGEASVSRKGPIPGTDPQT